MDENLRHQRDTAIGQLEGLIRRGREIRRAHGARRLPLDESRGRQPSESFDVTRAWQQDCAAAINQLSGGSKAHWLARAYSAAFMVRPADGAVVVEADAREIVDRIVDVLAQGASSLLSMDEVETASSGATPRPRRFEFVHNADLRPVLEQAFDDSRDAFARGEFALSLILSCGVVDALLTDALEADARLKPSRCDAGDGLRTAPVPAEPNGTPIAEWPFEQRIAEAERAGLIRGGCARLPPIARAYRDLTDADGHLLPGASVSERDARLAGQVLHVVMRDLDPGR